MWKIINSPIVIAIIVIAALFCFRAAMKPKLAGEIRAAYNELNSIIQDGSSDAEKSKAIQQFAQEIGTQIRMGLSEGFKSDNPQKQDKDKVYAAVKQKIDITGIKSVQSEWPTHEKIIFMLRNNSDKAISNLRLNYEYYKKGEMIDCRNDWMSEVKILDPNQEIALSQDRTLPKDTNDNSKSDDVKIKITSFDVKQAE